MMDKKDTQHVLLRMPKGMHQEIKRVAMQDRRSVNQELLYIIETYLKGHSQHGQP